MPKVISPRFLIFVLSFLIFVACAFKHESPVATKASISPLKFYPNPQNGYGSAADQLAQPDDVEILENGDLIVSDVDNNRIQVFSRSGELLKTIDAESLGMENPDIVPTGISSDAAGFIYVTLEGIGSVARFNADMTLDQLVGYQGIVTPDEYYLDENDGLLIKPQGIIVSRSGDIYVADMDKTIFRIDGVYNFGFRKFKQITNNDVTSYVYDKEFATTQEVTTIMRKSEGMAISEERGLLFVAEEKPEKSQFGNSEKFRYIGVFDLETGKFKNHLIGVRMVAGKIISGYSKDSIEGLSVFGDYIFAVDEKAGRVDCYNIDSGERVAHFGTPAPFYCDDESDCVIDGVNYNEQNIIAGGAQVHLLNDWHKNELASPDGVSTKTLLNGDKVLAVVDQWNSRILTYDINDILGKP
jgi:sugar lactone lactonase YvrE